jgi:Prophage protein (DUF1660)
MRIICFFFGHKWTKWRYVRALGRYDEMLSRKCIRCGNCDTYKGLTKTTKNGDRIPF